MYRYRNQYNDFEITKRELLFSVIILFAMVCLGFFVENAISNKILESNEIYYKAVKIDNNAEQFKYGMKTNIGNALVYGEFKAIGNVTMPELIGDYFAIEKTTQRYTRHTRTVTTTDSKGRTTTRTEVYYSWDNINTDEQVVDRFLFLDCEFDTTKITLNNHERLSLNDNTVSRKYTSWISGGYLYKDGDKWASVGDLRYKYKVIPKSFMGSMLTKLKDNSMYSFNNEKDAINIRNKTISEIIKDKQESEEKVTIIFWVIWVIFSIGIIVNFIYFDNNWLEDKK